MTPRLTTITYEKYEMGISAAQLLLSKINGEETESIIFKSDTIIERDSVFDLTKS